MEILKRPKSNIIESYKSISKLNLKKSNSILNKRIKIKINPLSQTIRHFSSNSNSFNINNQNKNKNSSPFNINSKNMQSTKNNYFKASKRYSIKAIDSSMKEKDKNKLEFRSSPLINPKSPLFVKKSRQFIFKFIKNYPKTFYQKISNSIEKMKIQTDKTLKAMRQNLKISNREVFHRTTSVVNIHRINKPKIKKKKIKKLVGFNSQNFENKTYLENSKLEKDNSSFPKFFKMHSFSERNNFQNSITNSSSNQNYSNLKNIQSLGLSKIPSTPFNNIKNSPFYTPLFKNLEMNRHFYKNMYHCRSFEMNDQILIKNTNKIYDFPNALIGLSSYEKEPEIQLRFIYNKIKLILDNIKHYKSNYMAKRDFRIAFINMENPIKAEYNYIMEELCTLLLRLIPQLLKDFYNSIDQLLFINIPEIDKEMQKKPSNEIECLKYNISFFNKVSDYFSACISIFNVIQKQIAEFKFTCTEFKPLNSNLDLARYDSTRLISMADSYIEKTKDDENVFTKFEIGLNLKKKKIEEKEEIDDFERFHKRRRLKVNEETIKIERINSALNIGANGMKKDFNFSDEKRKKIKLKKNPSILNSELIKDMMKYIENNIKAKIISQQVIERFKTKELKRIRNIEENNSINEVN